VPGTYGRVTPRWETPGRPPIHGLQELPASDPGGFVKLLKLRRSSGKRMPLPGPIHPLGGPLRPCDVGPTLESLPHLFAVLLLR